MKFGLLNTSHRRSLLDKDLTATCSALNGTVIDLGGEWKNRRGTFRPPHREDLHWLCFNFDPTVSPNALIDVIHVPILDACADAVVCTEVLEHIRSPEATLAEAYRILYPGGQLILSVPFLFPIHADPYDYQRYTAFKLEQMLCEAGFEEIEIHPQGLYFTVLADMIRDGIAKIKWTLLRWGLAMLFLPVAYLLIQWETRKLSPFLARYHAGYFSTARKV